jgi:large-conductance mechanosensitive channel
MLKYLLFNNVVFLCVGIVLSSIFFNVYLEQFGFDVLMLIVGNLMLCLVTLFSLYFLKSGMEATSTSKFLGAVYGSFIIKLVIVGFVVFVYAFTHKGSLNKQSLFTLMFLYLVYTFLEIKALLQIGKGKGNG